MEDGRPAAIKRGARTPITGEDLFPIPAADASSPCVMPAAVRTSRIRSPSDILPRLATASTRGG